MYAQTHTHTPQTPKNIIIFVSLSHSIPNYMSLLSPTIMFFVINSQSHIYRVLYTSTLILSCSHHTLVYYCHIQEWKPLDPDSYFYSSVTFHKTAYAFHFFLFIFLLQFLTHLQQTRSWAFWLWFKTRRKSSCVPVCACVAPYTKCRTPRNTHARIPHTKYKRHNNTPHPTV